MMLWAKADRKMKESDNNDFFINRRAINFLAKCTDETRSLDFYKEIFF